MRPEANRQGRLQEARDRRTTGAASKRVPAGCLRLHEKGRHAARRVGHLVDISGVVRGDDTVIFPALHYRFLIGGSMSRRLALAVLAAGLFAMAGGSVATQQLPPGSVSYTHLTLPTSDL